MMETKLDRGWAEQAIERIYKNTTLRGAITMTAGYITDSIKEMWRLMDTEAHEQDFHRFIDWVIQGSTENDFSPDYRPVWGAMREILDMTLEIDGMEEWGVEFEATQRLAPYLDPQQDRLDGIWILFRQILSCLLGWVEGTLQAVIEWVESQEVVSGENDSLCNVKL